MKKLDEGHWTTYFYACTQLVAAETTSEEIVESNLIQQSVDRSGATQKKLAAEWLVDSNLGEPYRENETKLPDMGHLELRRPSSLCDKNFLFNSDSAWHLGFAAYVVTVTLHKENILYMRTFHKVKASFSLIVYLVSVRQIIVIARKMLSVRLLFIFLKLKGQ
jgi:hypothetical protein